MTTVNLAYGCTKVSTECKYCYMYRLGGIFKFDPYRVEIKAQTEQDAIKKIKQALRKDTSISWAKGKTIIFVNSMSDTFHELIPFDIIEQWFEAFKEFPDKQFLILTKRDKRMHEYCYDRPIPDNCWMGVSCGIFKAKERIATLAQIDCKIRFISFEPILEDLGYLGLHGIQWAIIGGESDYKEPRSMKKEWVDSIIKQCRYFHIPIWFKQWGGKGGDGAGGDLYEGKRIQEYPEF